jgi:lysine-N-methylase
MAIPVLHLPVLQNWDCQATGTCCHEYTVPVTDEERRRITSQGWQKSELGGLRPFRRRGWFRGSYALNHRADGACVFLSANGRCRIHERHGYDTKPLACRLYPFVLVPVADHWRVSLHFTCPSAAASKGRPLAEHLTDLSGLGEHLAERERLSTGNVNLVPPPLLVANQHLDWPDLLVLVDHLLAVLHDRTDALERRWRKCLLIADLLRQTRLDQLPDGARRQTWSIVTTAAADLPRDPHQVAAPSALGRVLFRLAAALCTRKDRGPNRGPAAKGWLALASSVIRFANGSGFVPRMNRLVPEATFEQGETPLGPLNEGASAILERYYAVKVAALQFCGPAAYGLPFWEGLEALAVTLPLILWLIRLNRDLPQEEAVLRALTIVDGHFGSSPLLASRRLRLGFQALARRGELSRLIAWYSR